MGKRLENVKFCAKKTTIVSRSHSRGLERRLAMTSCVLYTTLLCQLQWKEPRFFVNQWMHQLLALSLSKRTLISSQVSVGICWNLYDKSLHEFRVLNYVMSAQA